MSRRILHFLKSSSPHILNFILVLALGVSALSQRQGFSDSFNHPAIRYLDTPLHDAATELNQRLQDGRVQLTFEPGSGYLPSVLKALNIDVDSQVLVYSETSADAPRISRRNPRSIFFNDTTAVGWVRGGDVEMAAHDPRQGVVFYVLKQVKAGKPRLERSQQCLRCHISWDTFGVPGMTMLSTGPPDPSGYATGGAIDDRTPFAERWGGWYVTGKPGAMRHMGNVPVELPMARRPSRPPILDSLDGQFDRAGYLSPHSDIVALMVFEHQTRVMNLITYLGWEARVGHDVRAVARDLADALLFTDEAPISGKIEGSSGFAARFAALGPRDHLGRSLREFDLEHRLMRYPCSYMIYTPAFDALPAAAKDEVYARLWETLSGPEGRAVVEILKETKRDLPSYFLTSPNPQLLKSVSVILEPVFFRLDVDRDVVALRDGGFLLPLLVGGGLRLLGGADGEA